MPPVRLVTVAPAGVLNLTHPRRDAAIVHYWRGRRDWHDPLYEPLRDIMEATYVAAMDAANGHYRRLEASMLAEGIRSPVMLVSGGVRMRRPSEIPPALRGRRDLLVSEYLGGSRLYVAEKHGLPVPAIVNDFADLFPGAPELGSVEEISACFPVRPGTVRLTPDEGAYVNDMHYAHMPAGYTLATQGPARRCALQAVRVAVDTWLKDNDRP